MKKYLSILLALALVLSLAACGTDDPASSDLPDPDVEGSGGELDVDDGSTPTDINAATPAPTPTPDPQPLETLRVCGVSIIKDSQLTFLALKGVKYEDGVLLLDAAELDSGTMNDILIEYSGGDLDVQVTGECVFTSSVSPSIKGDGDLTFTGDGSLSITAVDVAGISIEGKLTIGCALTITGNPAVESSETVAAEGYAIGTNDSGTLTVAAA